MYNDYGGWKLDYTTAQMIVTIKLTTFAYSYADGFILNAGEVRPVPKYHLLWG